jgi:hypothetical protein
MPLPDPASHARLAVIGVDLWACRSRLSPDSAATSVEAQPRVRLSSGAGSWLLVQRQPWDGGHSKLVSDITGLLGVDECRFGQWSGSGAAGLAISELAGRGVSGVIAFGPLPPGADEERILQVATLDELAASAKARRSLWQVLRPALER